MDTGHWKLANGLKYIPDAFGFIYEIHCVPLNKKYVGKKQKISKVKRKPLKGKTRNRIDYKESDWKTYTGSSKELNEDIAKFGKENFNFTILEWCGSKWELGYKEIKHQLLKDVILSEGYYNGILNVRIGKPPKDFLQHDKNIS
jgi:hypothetical protein